MNWFDRLLPSIDKSPKKNTVPEGLWVKCDACGNVLYKVELEKNLNVCPKCNFHLQLSGRERLNIFLDEKGREEVGADLEPVDVLKFKDTKKYKDRIVIYQKKTGEKDALVVMKGRLLGRAIVAAAFEFEFIGGSMGSVVGERFVKGAEAAMKYNIPYVCFSASGGARMQEGLYSLMQMAKTSAALAKMSNMGIPFISVLTHPTMGGVSASLAMLGDVNIAEPNALIGFAGPRVIEQTVREKLPDGFQRSEFLLEHGAVDMIVHRAELRQKISMLFSILHQGHARSVSKNQAFDIEDLTE